MKLTLTVPHERPAGPVAIPLPPSSAAPAWSLRGSDGATYLAERSPSGDACDVQLPPLARGTRLVFDVEETDGAPETAGVACRERDAVLEIDVAARLFAAFRFGEDVPKPVLNPILSPGGANLLREPMPAYGKGEHPWQRGLTLMHGAINGVDCWNEHDRCECGRTRQDAMTVTRGPLSLRVATANTWLQGDRPLMADRRGYRFFAMSREAVVLDIDLELCASYGPVTIGPTKEAGFLCVRVNPAINADAAGTMRNAYGADDESGCWSRPAHWMDYFGPLAGEVAGLAIFDHPANFRYPTPWHVRGYGLFAPNPWMFRAPLALGADATSRFRWRVLVHAGDTEQARVAARFLDYVDGPRAVWG